MKPIVFLDFDGVVVDTLDIAVKALQQQYPTMTPQLLRIWFEGDIVTSIQEHTISLEKFFAEYSKRLPHLPPVEGMPHSLSQVAEQCSIIIISSSLSTLIDEYMNRYSMRKYIGEILGVDNPGGKSEKFIQVARENNTPISNCIFVTDTLGDITESHSLGISTIAVSWGFHPKETLLKGKPEAIVAVPEDLLPAIQKLTPARER